MGIRNLTKADRVRLVGILLDHRDCICRPDFPMTPGKKVLEILKRHGIDPGISAEEIDSKANLVLEIDELVEKLTRAGGE